MTSFTTRYGDPAIDYKGAHLFGHSRHTAMVVSIGGRLDAWNVDLVTGTALHYISGDSPYILDLSAVTAFTPAALRLVDAAGERCTQTGVLWALVASEAVTRRIAGNRTADGEAGYPIAASVAEAEHLFDDIILGRRRGVASLRHTA